MGVTYKSSIMTQQRSRTCLPGIIALTHALVGAVDLLS